jgi:general nucleoside transport system permease protein
MIEFVSFMVVALDSAVRLSVPLLLACLAGMYSERAGIVDIGLEGKMLVAAFAAGVTAFLVPNPWVGMLAAITVAVLFALIHGYASINQRGNQIVSGVAINVLASGLTAVLGNAWFREGGRTPQLPGHARFQEITLPGADLVKDVPFLGTLYSEIISGHSAPVYLSLLAVPLTWFVFYRTRFGLRLRAVGENPHAVDTAGISVMKMRYGAVIVCGILCGMAGAYLAIGQSAGFINDMTAGKGFIALAALIFAKWRPVPALGACFLFGLLDAVAIRLQGVALPMIGQVPVQAIQSLPYILTVILLAGFIGKAIPPRAAGMPYSKDR